MKVNNIRIVYNVNDFEVYHEFRQDLINYEFQFNSILKRSAQKFLRDAFDLWKARRLLQMINAAGRSPSTYNQKLSSKFKGHLQDGIFVSVHVRRGDYAEWLYKNLKGNLVSKLFFMEAMSWFRNRVGLI